MAEHVRGDVLADAGTLRVMVYHKADGLVGQLAAQAVHKKISADLNVIPERLPVQRQRGDDFPITDLDDPFLGALSINQNVAALKVDVGQLQRAQLGNPHPGGEQQLYDGNIPDAAAELVAGFRPRLLRIQFGQKRPYGMKRNCLRQKLCLPEADVQPCERIFSQKLPVLQMAEERFQACNLAPDRLWLELPVQAGDKIIHGSSAEAAGASGAERSVLIQVDSVGLQRLGIQTLPVLAVFDVLCDMVVQNVHGSCLPLNCTPQEGSTSEDCNFVRASGHVNKAVCKANCC